jgi:predicted secreted protein
MSIKSFGVSVSVDGGAVGGLKDVNPGGGDVTFVDTTTHDAEDGWKTFVGGLKDGGTLELTGNYISGDAGQGAIRSEIGETVPCVVTFSDSSSCSFDGIVGAYNISNPLDDVVEFTASIKVTGPVNYSGS